MLLFCFLQGPFDTFLVGGDTAEVCDIKFSNDGKSMLLTTTNNNIYVLDAYGGEKVICHLLEDSSYCIFSVKIEVKHISCTLSQYLASSFYCFILQKIDGH